MSRSLVYVFDNDIMAHLHDECTEQTVVVAVDECYIVTLAAQLLQ